MKSLILCAALLMIGCSDMPTAPSSNPPPAGNPPPSTTTALRWDLVAPGCSPEPPPSPLPDPTAARLTPGPEGVIVATWPYILPSGVDGLLIARFMESNEMLVLCSWDTSDL
jgi:hypothetical protein